MYMETIFHTVINYVSTEYINFFKCIGVYFIVLSTMIAIGIENLSDKKKNFFQNSFIYFLAVFSVSLLVTGDKIIISFIGTTLYFSILFLAKKKNILI